jgi:hypothetical protein
MLTACVVQAHMKSDTPEARDKAWQMVKLMETVGTESVILST